MKYKEISKDTATPLEIAQNKALLQRICDSHEYFLKAMKYDIGNFNKIAFPTPIDILQVRALVFAHAGYNDAAIADFNVVISSQEGKTARNMNKLAQVLLRRGKDGDVETALKLSSTVIDEKIATTADERWFAKHNQAIAYMMLGKNEAAAVAARDALEEQYDPRTQTVLELVKAGGASDASSVLASIGAIISPGLGVFDQEALNQINNYIILRAESAPVLTTGNY